jgi:HEXXH motif-containing protein
MRHTLSDDLFLAFARGGGGVAGIAQLERVRLSRTMLLIRTLVRTAEDIRHERAGLFRRAYRSLAAVQRVAPETVRAVLGYPAVATWALRSTSLLRRGEQRAASPELLAGIAAAAAIRGSVTADIDLGTTCGGAFELPSLGTAIFPRTNEVPITLRINAHGAELRAGRTSVAVPADPHQEAAGWQGLRRICAEHNGRRFDALLDGRMNSMTPAALTPIRRMTNSAEVATWQDRLAASWRVLVDHHPRTAAEVGAVVRMVVPLAPAPTGLHSGTLRDAFGCVAMSLPPDDRLGAAALAHETQHAKLSVVMDLIRLVDPASGDMFYAPWREDIRPPLALLQGLYAHLGVAGFWRSQRVVESDDDRIRYAETEFALWRLAGRDSAGRLLASGSLTDQGRRFVAQIATLFDAWLAEPVSDAAFSQAARRAEEHRARYAPTT